jgi:hypothetical protein
VLAGAVGLAEGPFAFEGLLVALDLAVDLGSMRRDEEVSDLARVEELGERAVVGVCPGVVADQPCRLDPVTVEEGERTLDEADHRAGALVAVELGVREPGVVVDDRVHELPADTLAFLGTAAVASTFEIVERA